MTNRCPRVLIAGPTASGKSALAAELAERLGGIVVNVDAMQVYRDLRILTARPTVADEARLPHRLYGMVDAAAPWSVGLWLDAVERVLAESTALPLVFVGGTGLYFEALTRGLAAMPPIPAEIRARWRADERPTAELHAALADRDPEVAARLRPSDRQRILRALEVLEATGRSLLDWQRGSAPPLLDPATAHRLVLSPPREALHRRIEARFWAMLGEGALEEVGSLLGRGLDPNLPVMKALGVRPLAAHLSGATGLETATDRAVTETRQYAKRQSTWFRNRMADWRWLGAPFDLDRVLPRIV